MANKKKIFETREQKFIKLCAMEVSPYQAALQAGYAEATARTKAHKMARKYIEKIEKKKEAIKEIIMTELKYTINDVYDELEEVRKLSLLPDEDGNYKNLNAANKAIENKAKLIGAFEADNKQKTPAFPNIVVASEEDKQTLEDI